VQAFELSPLALLPLLLPLADALSLLFAHSHSGNTIYSMGAKGREKEERNA
jgi:hypothetical protein